MAPSTNTGREESLREERFKQLDGLRGWASFVVLLNHVFPNFLYHDAHFEQLSSLIREASFSFAYLANIAKAAAIVVYFFICDGTLAVKIFFVLSGYVLSIGYFSRGNSALVIDQALRRYVRLTVPILVTTMVAYGLLKMGLMYNKAIALNIDGAWISKFYSFPADFSHALSFATFSVYFDYHEETSYNFATWTMSVELIGSYFVFVFLLSIGKLRSSVGAYLFLFLIALSLSRFLPCFVAGMAVADYYSRRPSDRPTPLQNLPFSLLILPLLILSTLLTSKIANPIIAGIFETMVATMILVVAIYSRDTIRFLKRPISQFLGDISFPLYLIHPVILCSAASAFGVTVISAFGRDWGVPLTAAFSILASVGAAWILLPVEKSAIFLSRKTANLMKSSCAMIIERFRRTRTSLS